MWSPELSYTLFKFGVNLYIRFEVIGQNVIYGDDPCDLDHLDEY